MRSRPSSHEHDYENDDEDDQQHAATDVHSTRVYRVRRDTKPPRAVRRTRPAAAERTRCGGFDRGRRAARLWWLAGAIGVAAVVYVLVPFHANALRAAKPEPDGGLFGVSARGRE
jgi:hypothetical protein